jgi:hypothetical protein
MGFLLSVRVDLPEDEWRDILRIARRRGVSRLEALGDLQRVLEPQEARELASPSKQTWTTPPRVCVPSPARRWSPSCASWAPESRCILSTRRRGNLATNPLISGASGAEGGRGKL